LRNALATWRDNNVLFVPLATDNALLAELVPVSKALSTTASIGLEALAYLQSGKPAPAGWVAQQKKTLDAFQKPMVEVHLAAVRPVRVLLDALGGKR
jgi:hypothetical protein